MYNTAVPHRDSTGIAGKLLKLQLGLQTDRQRQVPVFCDELEGLVLWLFLGNKEPGEFVPDDISDRHG